MPSETPYSSPTPIRIDLESFSRMLAREPMAAQMTAVGLGDPASLLDSLVAGPSKVTEMSAGIRLTTDDLPWAAIAPTQTDSLTRIAHVLLRERESSWKKNLEELGIEVEPGDELSARLSCLRGATQFLIHGRCDRARELCPEAPKVRTCFIAESKRTRWR